jgi:nucleotide-binding universal stress UspA family protein
VTLAVLSERHSARSRSVVCGVDGSAPARVAARVAAALAQRLGLRLVAVHVMAPAPERRAGSHLLAAAGARGVINDAMSAARARAAEARVERGPAALHLALVAAEEDAAAMVLGAHGERGRGSAALGTVAAAAVALSPCPVVIIPAPAVQAARRLGDGELVVARREAPDTLAVAAELARGLGTRLRLARAGISRRPRPSLIVVGPREPGPRRGDALDPIARHLLREATVPVMIIAPLARRRAHPTAEMGRAPHGAVDPARAS